jgi:hypothetical protein
MHAWDGDPPACVGKTAVGVIYLRQSSDPSIFETRPVASNVHIQTPNRSLLGIAHVNPAAAARHATH